MVDNRAGAGGTIATDITAKAPPDGYSLLNSPDVQRRLMEQGVDPAPSTPDQFAAFIRTETEKWAKVVKDAGVPQQ